MVRILPVGGLGLALIAAQCAAFGQSSPPPLLTKERVVRAVEYRVLLPDELIERVVRRGVDFQLAPEERHALQRQGFSQRVLTAVQQSHRPAPVGAVAPKAAVAGDNLMVGAPLMLREVLLLLRARVPVGEVAKAVEARGVDFALTAEANRTIWKAGGDRVLMGEILLNAPTNEPPAAIAELLKSSQDLAGQAPERAPVAATAQPAPAPVTPPLVASSFVPVRATPAVQSPVVPKPTPVAPKPAPEARPAASEELVDVPAALQSTRLVERVMPTYPSVAAARKLTGVVRLEIVVGTDGKVSQTRVLTGDSLLAYAAQSAVKRWVYRPAIIGGVAVRVRSEVELAFRP